MRGPSLLSIQRENDVCNQKNEVHVDHIPVRLHLLPQEDADDHEHAHDGDGEADIGDVVQVGVVLRHGVLVDVEDEGKVGEVGAGALGVGGVVAHLNVDQIVNCICVGHRGW